MFYILIGLILFLSGSYLYALLVVCIDFSVFVPGTVIKMYIKVTVNTVTFNVVMVCSRTVIAASLRYPYASRLTVVSCMGHCCHTGSNFSSVILYYYRSSHPAKASPYFLHNIGIFYSKGFTVSMV